MPSFLLTFYRLGKAVRKGFRDAGFRNLTVFLIAILLSGSLFYHYAEGWRYLDSLYFSVTTLTTVHQTTDISKIFTIFYIIAGIGTMFAFITSIAGYTARRTIIHEVMDLKKMYTEDKKKEENEKQN